MTKAIIEQHGIIVDKMSDTRFRVKLDESEKVVLAHTSGKMKQRYIKVYPGDRVQVELAPFSMDNARIVYRYKK